MTLGTQIVILLRRIARELLSTDVRQPACAVLSANVGGDSMALAAAQALIQLATQHNAL